MYWNIISSIASILAAFAGIISIWLNLRDKTKKLSIRFEPVPIFKICICNESLRSARLTKMQCYIKKHLFYVEYFEKPNEIFLPPSTIKTTELNKALIYKAYHRCQIDKLCNPADKITIIIHDNYNKKYKINTFLTIGMLKTNNGDESS